MENFFELSAKRESCRNFAEKPVETTLLRRCVEAARLAPSACNSQPWSFTVVNNMELSPKVAKALQELGMNKFTDKCPAFIVITEERANLTARVGGKVKSQEYASVDIGIATAHLVLAAAELGLSTCIIGMFNESKLKELLAIPKAKRIRLAVAIGYAANDKLREKNRKKLEDIAQFL